MVDSERLARRFFSYIAQGRGPKLAEMLDAEVELMLKTRPGEVLRGREAVVRFLEDAAERMHETVPEVYRPLDDERIVVEGRIRWSNGDRVLRDDPVIWALEFRDGLLVRSTPAQTVLEAEAILAAGPDELSPA